MSLSEKKAIVPEAKNHESPAMKDPLIDESLLEWFHSPKIHAGDGLDDYDQDFSQFSPLTDIITADMKHHSRRLEKTSVHTEKSVEHAAQTPAQERDSHDKNEEINIAVPEQCGYRYSRFKGCHRCLDVCPAAALKPSADTGIRIIQDQCTDCGLCASICPSGALPEHKLPLSKLLERVCDAIDDIAPDQFHAQGRLQMIVHEGDIGQEIKNQLAAQFPGTCFFLAAEPMGAAMGLDFWFSAMACGVDRILLVPSVGTMDLLPVFQTQVAYAAQILTAIGYKENTICLVTENETPLPAFGPKNGSFSPWGYREVRAASLVSIRSKPQRIHAALAYLGQDSGKRDPEPVLLPEGAPVGAVRLDTERCTFCMACVQVCPADALEGGSQQPRIRFDETRCIQCGLCTAACPENALRLQAQMTFDLSSGGQWETLNQDTPLICAGCSRPFAPARLIHRMAARLENHWMYNTPEDQHRLTLCRDCRVQNLYDQIRKGENR